MSGQTSNGIDGENAAEDDESNRSKSSAAVGQVSAGADQADGTNSNMLGLQIVNDHDKEIADDYLLYEQNGFQNGGSLGQGGQLSLMRVSKILPNEKDRTITITKGQ